MQDTEKVKVQISENGQWYISRNGVPVNCRNLGSAVLVPVPQQQAPAINVVQMGKQQQVDLVRVQFMQPPCSNWCGCFKSKHEEIIGTNISDKTILMNKAPQLTHKFKPVSLKTCWSDNIEIEKE